MRTKKRIFPLLLAICFLVGIMPMSAYAAEQTIAFYVGEEPVTATNAFTIDETKTVYGNDITDMVTLVSGLTAKIGDTYTDADSSHFTLSVSGIPDAGTVPFKVLYNGTLGGEDHTDTVVCEGSVTVARKIITISIGDLFVTKVYDGTTDPGATRGSFRYDGLLDKDAYDLQFTFTLPYYTSADINGQTEMDIILELMGTAADNYYLSLDGMNASEFVTLTVPCYITPRPVTLLVNQSSKTYGEEEPVLSYTVDSATPLVAGETLGGELSRMEGEDVGTYPFKLTEDNANYDITFAESFTIEKADLRMASAPNASAIEYGQTLVSSILTGGKVDSTVSGGEQNISGTWSWVDDSIHPTATGDYTGKANFTPAAGNHYNDLIGQGVTVNVTAVKPTIVISADPGAIAGKAVEVTATVKNPYDESLTDAPAATLTYKIGSGAEQALTDGNFSIPADTPIGTVITITATTSTGGNYVENSAEAIVTVVECKHTDTTILDWDTDAHWHECACGAQLDKAAHSGGTVTCKDKATCSVCGASYGSTNSSNHTGGTETRNQSDSYTGDIYCLGCGVKLQTGTTIGGGGSADSGNSDSGSGNSGSADSDNDTPPVPAYVTYTVQRGDSLWAIAKKHGCTVSAIVEANSDLIKNPDLIYAGWQLKIPQAGATGTDNTPDAILPDDKKTTVYIVQRGDSLWAISRKYGCTIAEIIALNGELIDTPDLIFAGWELKIPQN